MDNSEQYDGGSILTEAGGGVAPPPDASFPPDQADGADGVANEAPQYDSSDWRASLPDDIRSSPTMEKFTTVDGLAKSYVNLEQRLGKHLPMPETEEQREEIYTALGRPEDSTQYEFETIEMPQGMEYDGDGEQYFRNVVHKAGLSDAQAKQLHKDYFQLMVQRHANYQQAQTVARSEAERALRREQGPAYDGFVSDAKSTLRQYATPEFLKRLDDSGMGNDPEMIRVFGRIGRDMGGEKTLVNNMGQPNVPGDAQKAAETFRTQHADALYNNDHPEHDMRTRELWSLMQQAFPGQ